jgi:hypothetical protein
LSFQCLRPSASLRAAGNKTENAFSPLPVRTKAFNADMTACLPLHYKTALFRLQVYQKFLPPRWSLDNKATVRGYGQIILPSRCMNSRTATCGLPGCSGSFSNCMRVHSAVLLQWQFLKLHIAVNCRGRIPWCMQYACARCCPVAAWASLV